MDQVTTGKIVQFCYQKQIMFVGSHVRSYNYRFIKLGIQMSKTFRKIILASALAIAALGTASAGVVTSKGISYTATLANNVLSLEIDAAGRCCNLSGADYLDGLTFGGITNLTGGQIIQAPANNASIFGDIGWTATFINVNGNTNDTEAITANTFLGLGGTVALVDNMFFQIKFLGNNLNYSGLFVNADFDFFGVANNMSDKVFLNTAVTPPSTHIPEPASLAMMGAGLSMLGFMRRRKAGKATA
jgi:hypothetical protein